jgi:hypothetical protein
VIRDSRVAAEEEVGQLGDNRTGTKNIHPDWSNAIVPEVQRERERERGRSERREYIFQDDSLNNR